MDGPAVGRSIEAETIHPVIWLCELGDKRWWTFTEPVHGLYLLETYSILGLAPRRGEKYLALYGVKND